MTLSLQDRYKALAEGRQLQIDFDGRWVSYDASKHPLNLANEWRIKPNVVEGFNCNRELWTAMCDLVGRDPTGFVEGSDISSVMHQLRARLDDMSKEITALKREREENLPKVAAYDYAQKEWDRVQALCSRIAPNRCGHSVLTILCDHIEADEKLKNDLRGALIACGTAAGARLIPGCSDSFLCDVPAEVRSVIMDKDSEITHLRASAPITDADREALGKVINVIEKMVKAKR
jgi:hypothetical protein